MKSHQALAFALALLVLVLYDLSVRAEDWTTTDGKVYPQVTVVKTEPDAVTILYRDGGALIPLAKLPANLQQRFHYDPDKAQTAADARASADQTSAQALEVEKAQAKKLQAAQLAKDKAAQQAAHAADKADMESSSVPGFKLPMGLAAPPDANHHPLGDFANPTNYVNGDVLGQPK